MTADSTGAPDEAADTTATVPPREFEASLAPRDGDLLSLPFDQYGRMRIVQNVLARLYEGITSPEAANANADDGSSTLTVLDVGGYPGVLRYFVPGEQYAVSVLDVGPDDGSIPNYTQGSGMDLPFPDGSFDVVTALDTLEHIPNPERVRFLAEAMRVARNAVVLVNPVQSVEADVAEETLNEYIRWILDAQQEQLREHREFGLPDFGATVAAFQDRGWQTLGFPVANVYNWLLMMVAKHYLISMRDEKASGFERTLDRFYNLTFSDSDRSQPAYRGVMVAVRPGLESALQHIQAAYPPVDTSAVANTERLQLTQVLMTLLDLKTANHEDRLLREQIEARDHHVMSMEQRLAVMDIQLDRANHELQEMSELRKSRDELLESANELRKSRDEALSSSNELQRSHEGLRLSLDELQHSIEAKNTHIANLTSRLENEVRSKDEHILYLERLLQGIEAGRVLRITRRVSRLLGR